MCRRAQPHHKTAIPLDIDCNRVYEWSVMSGPEVVALSLRSVRGVTVIDVRGRLSAETSRERQLVRAVRRLLDDGHLRILLNLDGVRQIDSSGLTELVESHATAARRGGEIKLVHVTRYVGELLRITGLGRVFETFDVEAEAIDRFAGRGPA